MFFLRSLVAVLLAVVALPAAAAGDAAAGSKKNFQCQGCHGVVDWKTAFPELYSVPRLAGQHADYLATAISHYKNGKRKNPIMQGQVANLSQRDILDLTAYYSRLPGLKTQY